VVVIVPSVPKRVFEKGEDNRSRDREGAVYARETRPLPYGRGSERGFLNTL
jgi:hypothetical protein